MINYMDFYANLKKIIENSESQHKNILGYCPEFYLLLCNILIDKKSDWNTKILVNSAIAYFVVKEDIIPDDSKDGMGFIDDLFITSFVLMEIKENIDKNLLIDNWQLESDILSIVEDVFTKSKILVGDKYIDILKLVGLKKYISLDLCDFGDYSKRLSRIAKEKLELLGLLAFVTQKCYSSNKIRDLEGVKRVLKGNEDYAEIERIIAISQERRNEFNTKVDSCSESEIFFSDELRTKRLEQILRGMDK